MTKRKQVNDVKFTNAADAIRQGWLAYLGAYGLAYDRAKPAIRKLSKKYASLFGDLVEKGEEIETTAKEQFADAAERAKELYADGVDNLRSFRPANDAGDRVKELEAEIEALTKKLSMKAKKAAPRKAKTIKAAKAA